MKRLSAKDLCGSCDNTYTCSVFLKILKHDEAETLRNRPEFQTMTIVYACPHYKTSLVCTDSMHIGYKDYVPTDPGEAEAWANEHDEDIQENIRLAKDMLPIQKQAFKIANE